MSRGPAIGIDLGTTFSCVGIFQGNKVEIIANGQGSRTTPSCVAFTEKRCLVGEDAKNQEVMNPANTVSGVKCLIGRTFDDKAVQDGMRHWPFKVINSEGRLKIEVQHCNETKRFFPEQISSMVLSKMKETAEAYLDANVTDAVITVPAYFNDNQRQATIDAGKIAGLNVLRLINEPTAAAIAYNMDKRMDRQRNVLIYDWGGGTFDVSILSIEKGKIEVLAVGGDTNLGGEDINSRLVDHFVKVFKNENNGKDLTTSKKAISRLRKACEQAKRSLSSVECANIDIDSLFEGTDFTTTITRVRFENLCSDLFSRTMDVVKTTLNNAKIEEAYIHEVVLVGGSTRIPKVQELLQSFFKGKEVKKSVNPDEAVAYGAALFAANVTGQRPAAMQDLMLLEVTPLSLGLKHYTGSMKKIVQRQTPIPTERTQCWETAYDNQTTASFQIFEGERERASDNHLLGGFEITGLPPKRRGEIKFDVTFEIDDNSILHVSAVERSTKKQNNISITKYRNRLSEKEIEQLLEDAKKLRQQDEKERLRMAAMGQLVDYSYIVRRQLEEDKVRQKTSQAYRKKVLAKCEETIRWADANKEATKEDCENKHKELEQECSLLKGMTNLSF